MVQSECQLGLQIFSDILDHTHVYVRSLQMSVEYIFSVKSNTAMNRTDIALGSQQIEACGESRYHIKNCLMQFSKDRGLYQL